MKRLVLCAGALVLGALLLASCGSSAPYSIFKRQEGTGAKAVFVEVPANAPKSDLLNWGREIEASEKVSGKTFMVAFFYGGHAPKDTVGTYSNGAVY